jgi:hypothetical protein
MRVQGAGDRVQGAGQYSLLKNFFNHEPHEQAWRGLIARNPFFVHGKHGKLGKFFLGFAASTDEIARGFVIWSIGFSD